MQYIIQHDPVLLHATSPGTVLGRHFEPSYTDGVTAASLATEGARTLLACVSTTTSADTEMSSVDDNMVCPVLPARSEPPASASGQPFCE